MCKIVPACEVQTGQVFDFTFKYLKTYFYRGPNLPRIYINHTGGIHKESQSGQYAIVGNMSFSTACKQIMSKLGCRLS